ncbi:hypothetical protein FZEAL_4903 [Fusarium zealandicum]|uniref:N-acetyltransferase domain-containing protein n=1 Tax=Fusarium zealandicum TaxID=1053134 RepID=A0A8H4XLF6_9HYPO|nr:hypothetical protein FZEAL_4903 [Fusarium zealandicum]
MAFEIAVPSEQDAPSTASTHLTAMDANLLMHAQFPTAESRDFLRNWLCRDTLNHVSSSDKKVLISRDTETGRIASFIKWSIQRQIRLRGNEDESHEEELPACCRQEYIGSYAALTKDARIKVLGDQPHYHVTYLCTDPDFGGRGAASGLLRRVQAEAAADSMPVILEATMNAVSFYERLGFETRQELDMMLPPRGSSLPTERYEERTMLEANIKRKCAHSTDTNVEMMLTGVVPTLTWQDVDMPNSTVYGTSNNWRHDSKSSDEANLSDSPLLQASQRERDARRIDRQHRRTQPRTAHDDAPPGNINNSRPGLGTMR